MNWNTNIYHIKRKRQYNQIGFKYDKEDIGSYGFGTQLGKLISPIPSLIDPVISFPNDNFGLTLYFRLIAIS